MTALTPARVPIRERSAVERRPAGVGQIAGEDPDAVAAHLRLRAVRVAVVHEPLGAGSRGIRALVDRGRTHDPEDAVPADAEPSIAQHGDLVVAEIERAVGVGDHDEVVAGAMTFRERDGLRHGLESMGARVTG